MKNALEILTVLLILMLLTPVTSRSQAKESRVDIETSRYVIGNTLVSQNLPNIQIEVSDEFQYIGVFDFEIIATSSEWPPEVLGKPIAGGERFVFAQADPGKKVQKLFIVQLEGFLESNDFIYNYNFANADSIGNNRYRRNTWFYNSQYLAEQNPQNEGPKTRQFLKEMGFQLEDEYMMSRFVGLASADKRHEIIIFYQEMLRSETGYTLYELEHSLPQEVITQIEANITERSRQSFKIID